MTKYKIITPDGVKEKEGEVLSSGSRKVIVYKSFEHGFWFVHDYESGLFIAAGDTKVNAGVAAKIILKSMTISKERLKREFQISKLPYPLNHEN